MISKLGVYQRSRNFLWTDPHIAKQMLQFHLDPASDAASRNEHTIDSTVRWLQKMIPEGCTIIDLGCGPGLYAEKLATLQYKVTGMDISKNSLRYAKKSAKKHKLDIRYFNRSYLKKITGSYQAAMCIYCDFGALTPQEQITFLDNVSRCLVPGGILLFDVFGESLSETKKEEKNWEHTAAPGFWSKKPHYILHECTYFSAEKAWGTRNVIIESGKVKEFITWDTMYSEERIGLLLKDNGFKLEAIERN